MQQRTPDPPRQRHHPVVVQELRQIPPHRRRRGRIGRAEVDEQDGGGGVALGVGRGRRGHPARMTGWKRDVSGWGGTVRGMAWHESGRFAMEGARCTRNGHGPCALGVLTVGVLVVASSRGHNGMAYPFP